MAQTDAIFEACLTQLASGAAVDACLAQIPAETPEVAPLVEIAVALRSLGGPLPEIDAQARQQARLRFLSHAKALSEPSSLPVEQALDESIAKLATGASIDECLDAYPHHAAQLGALLATVVDLQKLGNVRSSWQATSAAEARQGFLARAAVLRNQSEVTVEEALDASIQMTAAGATIDTCLETFPQHAAELRVLLQTIVIAQQGRLQVPLRARKTELSQKQAFLAAAAALKPAGLAPVAAVAARSAPSPVAPPAPPWWQTWVNAFRQPVWRGAMAVALVLILLIGFGRAAVTVASGALPGDALYPVKLLAEQTRMVLTVDNEQRAQLQQQFNQTRLEEAGLVATLGREVLVQLPGVIQSIDGDTWTIFGLDWPVLVNSATDIKGVPGVGKRVLIIAMSDGQGKLVAQQVTILEDPPFGQAPADMAPPPSNTSAPFGGVSPILPPTRTPTPSESPGATETATVMVSATVTFSPSVTVTATASSTVIPSVSPSTTPSTTPTVTPGGPNPVNFTDIIQEIHPDWWLVGGRTVRIDDRTTIDQSLGTAEPGAEVRVVGIALFPSNDIQATSITVVRPAGGVQVNEFTGTILEMNGDLWLIGNTLVDVSEATINGTAAIGSVATVRAERQGDEIWMAVWVNIQDDPEPVYISGIIDAVSSASIVVDGTVILIDADTQFTGVPPAVGLRASVRAIERSDGYHALSIDVDEPTPTSVPPTVTPVPPTATPTPQPPTDTPEPPTLTPEPPTDTPEPPTPTPEPPTDTPEPPTPTPQPPTDTPEPPTPTTEPLTARPALVTSTVGNAMQEAKLITVCRSVVSLPVSFGQNSI